MADFTPKIGQIETQTALPVLVSEFESGAEQRRKKGELRRKSWRITTPYLLAGDMAALRTFYESKGGRLTAFTFTDPEDGVTYTVRFDSELKVTEIPPAWFQANYTLKRVI